MRYIKFFFGCLRVFWKERKYPNSRAKFRRMAWKFNKVAMQCGLGSKAQCTVGKRSTKNYGGIIMKNFQFVSWYPEWIGLGKRRFFGYLARIYKWSICLGFWERGRR